MARDSVKSSDVLVGGDFRKSNIDDLYVRVDVPSAYGFTSDDAYWQRNAREVVEQVNRHVDADGASVRIEWSYTCQDCGYNWTEDSHVYNGGCCDADQLRGTALGEIADDDLAICRKHDAEWDKKAAEYLAANLNHDTQKDG